MINSIVFTHDGRRLASWAADGRIIFWDIESRQQLFTLKGYSPDGKLLAVATEAGMITLWDIDKKEKLRVM